MKAALLKLPRKGKNVTWLFCDARDAGLNCTSFPDSNMSIPCGNCRAEETSKLQNRWSNVTVRENVMNREGGNVLPVCLDSVLPLISEPIRRDALRTRYATS